MNIKFTHILTNLLILAFLTAGISPACHFISGTNQDGFIEICTSNGEIQKISLAEAGLTPDQKPQRHNKQAQEQCMFCFSSSNAKHAAKTVKAFKNKPTQNHIYNGRGLFVPGSLQISTLKARAPPLSFST